MTACIRFDEKSHGSGEVEKSFCHLKRQEKLLANNRGRTIFAVPKKEVKTALAAEAFAKTARSSKG